MGSSTRNLTVFDFCPHTEKLTVCDENSWLARLCFLTVTPFYEPITEVVLLTCYLRGCKQSCLRQGLGVTFTARKHPSKLMFIMKDLGHMLPGRQN